jgi:hypothetical protein
MAIRDLRIGPSYTREVVAGPAAVINQANVVVEFKQKILVQREDGVKLRQPLTNRKGFVVAEFHRPETRQRARPAVGREWFSDPVRALRGRCS